MKQYREDHPEYRFEKARAYRRKSRNKLNVSRHLPLQINTPETSRTKTEAKEDHPGTL